MCIRDSTNVTLPYVLEIADHGLRAAAQRDPALALGISTVSGQLVSEPVGQAHGLPVAALSEVLV